ncbi:type I restriction enzyme S subunit [Dokdonia sp. Hel_I_63]|uniref:restriction endonuclease subunit S n=1 Tax=Dokdonia sp. Hel_I_63 TaxID=1249996 RepID=UPI001199F7F4|nr:restriction endonuclease subunit S [Dokdonia sp. Hel_I_63]TVZ23457.1 type I restriction enzyme S subunit [Dokdonia sp. Hel_I_63]
MEKYSEYKDSGIEWLDEIPENWKLDRIKNIGTVKARVGWKALKASEYVKTGYFFLSTPNIKKVNIDYKNVNYITKERYYESPEIMLKDGDILLVKDGSTLGIVNIITNLEAEGTVNSSIGVLRLKKQHNKYFYYFLKSNYLQNIIGLKKEGMGVPHLFQKDINNFTLSIPPLKEQTQIANYLDVKTTAIDKKVNLLQQKIKHYKAYRKTLINETVTKGLDKTVKLKDSGIDWIGEIPEHWEVKRIKDIFNTLAGGTPSTKEKSFWIGEIPWIPSGAVQNGEVNSSVIKSYISEEALLKTSTKMARKDSILIALTGATCSNIGYLNFDTTINQSIVSIDSNQKYTSHRYYFYFLISAKEKIRTLMTGGAQGGINQGDVKYFKICFTSKTEQQQIADYLDAKTATIDKIVKNIETQIVTLKELRKTLINEVVTGKVKVSA